MSLTWIDAKVYANLSLRPTTSRRIATPTNLLRALRRNKIHGIHRCSATTDQPERLAVQTLGELYAVYRPPAPPPSRHGHTFQTVVATVPLSVIRLLASACQREHAPVVHGTPVN